MDTEKPMATHEDYELAKKTIDFCLVGQSTISSRSASSIKHAQDSIDLVEGLRETVELIKKYRSLNQKDLAKKTGLAYLDKLKLQLFRDVPVGEVNTP